MALVLISKQFQNSQFPFSSQETASRSVLQLVADSLVGLTQSVKAEVAAAAYLPKLSATKPAE